MGERRANSFSRRPKVLLTALRCACRARGGAWVVSALGLAGLGVAAAFPPDRLPRIPLCAFHASTGLPCPGCGLTRSVCAAAHGELGLAWSLHPLGPLFLPLFAAMILWPFAVKRWPAVSPQRVLCSPHAGRAGILFGAALWAFGLWRIFHVLSK